MSNRVTLRSWRRIGPVLAALAGTAAAWAQERPLPAGTPLPPYARVLTAEQVAQMGRWSYAPSADRPAVFIMGYWPPTNEMIRRFSPDAIQNPEGWLGDNWEGRGYNVYGCFPEFPQGLGKGEGDFEVDYQDTSADFWRLVPARAPLAVITTGRAYADYAWELEWRQRNLPEASWYPDYLAPVKPTPSPPDANVPANYIRYSTLPMDEIVRAINDAAFGVYAFKDTGEGYAGAFLCEFAAYHAAWYHDLHADPNEPAYVIAGGHIHVGSAMSLQQAVQATHITLRTTIARLNRVRLNPGELNCDGAVNFGDVNPFVLALSDPDEYERQFPDCNLMNGDCNGDGAVNFGDVNPFVELLSGDRKP